MIAIIVAWRAFRSIIVVLVSLVTRTARVRRGEPPIAFCLLVHMVALFGPFRFFLSLIFGVTFPLKLTSRGKILHQIN